MLTVYLACLVMGLIGIVGALVIGEAGGDAEAGDATGTGPPLLSVTSTATALLGLGAGGTAATSTGANPLIAGLVATASAIALVALTRGVLLRYLLRQQANSHLSRQQYIGLLGTVTIAIPPGEWGEVAFTDPDGNRVRGRALTAEQGPLPAGTTVYIGDVDDTHLHVVTAPSAEASN